MGQSRVRIYVYVILLLLVMLFWGSTFILVKKAVELVDVFSFLGIRFSLAALILSAALGRRWQRAGINDFRRGAALGIFLFLAYSFQTLGLTMTSASNAGFITGLSVIIVPVASAFVFRYYPPAKTIAGVVLASAGLFLMTGIGGPGARLAGDLLVLVCAVFVAIHILMTAKFVESSDPFILAAIQLGTVAACSLAIMFLQPAGHFSFEPVVIWAWIITVLFATIFAFTVQMAAQRVISPTNTALIFTMEPVFAALFAHYFGGEVMSGAAMVGGAMIFIGMVLPEISPREWAGYGERNPEDKAGRKN